MAASRKTTTARGQATREQLVDVTASLVRKQGYQQTGFRQILEHSGVSRGSLFFHFPGGKDELIAAAITRGAQVIDAGLLAQAGAASSAGDALQRVCEWFAKRLVESDYSEGCPVTTTALEACGTSESLQQTCQQVFQGWLQQLEALLTATGREPELARDLATVALSTIEGAVMLSRVQRSPHPLQAAGRTLYRLLEGD